MSEAMKPGRELDALVAEKVMGLPVIAFEGAPCPDCGGEMRYCGARSWCHSACHEWKYSPYRAYSTDIAAAWEVVAYMENHLRGVLTLGSPCDDNPKWRAVFTKKWVADLESYPQGVEHGVTAPHAICLAALRPSGDARE